MTTEATGGARAALAAFPGLAGVTVIENSAGQDDQYLIAYVMSSGPGLSYALGVRVSMPGLFRAPIAGAMDRRLGQMAGARK